MCIATVYSDDGTRREKVMQDIVWIEAEGNGFLCISLPGERKLLEGKLKSIDSIQEHSVVLEKDKKGHREQI